MIARDDGNARCVKMQFRSLQRLCSSLTTKFQSPSRARGCATFLKRGPPRPPGAAVAARVDRSATPVVVLLPGLAAAGRLAPPVVPRDRRATATSPGPGQLARPLSVRQQRTTRRSERDCESVELNEGAPDTAAGRNSSWQVGARGCAASTC